MARNCNCAGSSCSCSVIGGAGITVTGTGTAANPFIVTDDGASLTNSLVVDDTTTVAMSLLGGGVDADPFVLSAVATVRVTDLVDVTDPDGAPVDGDVLTYVGAGASGHWEFLPQALPEGGGTSDAGMTEVDNDATSSFRRQQDGRLDARFTAFTDGQAELIEQMLADALESAAVARRIDLSQRWIQDVPAQVWDIVHSLPFYPTVTILNSEGTVVQTEITHLSPTSIRSTAASAFSGIAQLS